MTVYTFDIGETETGECYVNAYHPDECGTLRRETIADGLTRDEANALHDTLTEFADRLTLWTF